MLTTAVTRLKSRSGWNWAPTVPATQCRGQLYAEVRGVGEVFSRIIVPVTGDDHHRVIVRVLFEEHRDAPGDVGSTGHRQRAAFAEVKLDVHDHQCTTTGGPRAFRTDRHLAMVTATAPARKGRRS